MRKGRKFKREVQCNIRETAPHLCFTNSINDSLGCSSLVEIRIIVHGIFKGSCELRCACNNLVWYEKRTLREKRQRNKLCIIWERHWTNTYSHMQSVEQNTKKIMLQLLLFIWDEKYFLHNSLPTLHGVQIHARLSMKQRNLSWNDENQYDHHSTFHRHGFVGVNLPPSFAKSTSGACVREHGNNGRQCLRFVLFSTLGSTFFLWIGLMSLRMGKRITSVQNPLTRGSLHMRRWDPNNPRIYKEVGFGSARRDCQVQYI